MKIIREGNKILRQKAQKINLKDISSTKIKNMINEMKKTLHTKENGVALAAPQIGESLRLFIVSNKVFNEEQTNKSSIKCEKNTVYINPKITRLSKKTDWLEEGCLSVKGIHGKVKRSKNCNIEAYNEHGKKFTRGAGNLLSQIYQHEIDHLDGILFIDKAKDLETIK